MRYLHLLLPLLALAACKQEGTAPVAKASATPAAATPDAAPSAIASATAPSIAGIARKVSEENGLYSFDYSYPAQAGAIPALKAWLDGQVEKERSELIAEARKGRAEAKQGGYTYNAYYRASGWDVVAELPGWLSLSQVIETYGGGAHPNHWPGALLWDKGAGKRRAALDLFTSKPALSQAIRQQFCAQIDREREKRRGEKIDRGSDEMFNDCIDPVEQTVLLGSSNRRTFDRIGILVAPYEAGPYVEGEYEATVPVTEAVLAVVKPEFRASFTVKR